MFNIHFVILCNCFDGFSCESDEIVSKHVHVVLTYPGMTMNALANILQLSCTYCANNVVRCSFLTATANILQIYHEYRSNGLSCEFYSPYIRK